MLAEILAAVQNGVPANVIGSVTWSGQSLPLSEETDFDWEMRIDITITGTITLDLPS
jgi:hypothetical protein